LAVYPQASVAAGKKEEPQRVLAEASAPLTPTPPAISSGTFVCRNSLRFGMIHVADRAANPLACTVSASDSENRP
jgi:hypothetical protein